MRERLKYSMTSVFLYSVFLMQLPHAFSLLRTCAHLNVHRLLCHSSMPLPANIKGPNSQDHSIIANELLQCDSLKYCMILRALYEAKYTWTNLPKSLTSLVELTFLRLEPSMDVHAVSLAVLYLGQMNDAIEASQPLFLNMLMRATTGRIANMNAKEVISVFMGLGSSGLAWGDLPRALQWGLNSALRRTGRAMPISGVASCAYSVTMLCFDATDISEPAFRGVHETLLGLAINSMRPNSREILALTNSDAGQLRLFAHYAYTLNRVTNARKRVEGTLLPALATHRPSTQRETAPSCSYLQRRITEAFETELARNLGSNSHGQVRLVREHSSFGGCLPVDIAILNRGKVRALVEVDGPHHYRSGDNTLTRTGQCKETLYKAQHPVASFHRVRWDDERELGAEFLARQFCAQYLPTIVKEVSPWRESLERAYENLSQMFAWCLRGAGTHDEDENLSN